RHQQVAQLGLVAVVDEAAHVTGGDLRQRQVRWYVAWHLARPALMQLRQLRVEDVVEQRLLGLVVEIHPALAEPRVAGDVQEAGWEVAAAHEAPGRRGPDLPLALVDDLLACHRCPPSRRLVGAPGTTLTEPPTVL